ncbi:LysR family transcriptional regulator [Salinisphaera sp.]|uniref:LysR family transcriptional regulator n=1 Tax=Salinisphaera sp. TaxID=1914330 RepID=UPI000C65260A|nr:LysR family transcriptional regulator [Salinisphaera sp.]MBS61585.1 LysR family transcriptional regulator [Salinisphaera sp.]
MQTDIAWDDLRLVLAIARAETLAGAARTLGLHHATVYRRLIACERALGTALFERDRGRHVPTAAGAEWVAVADDMDGAVIDAARRIAGRDVTPAGTVRLTTTDTLLHGLVSPVLGAFRQRFPAIRLDVRLSNAPLDLARRDADLAIRAADAPPDPLIAQRLGDIAMARYRCAQHAPPPNAWVGLSEAVPFAALHRWMAAYVDQDDIALQVDSMLAMQRAVADGVGEALLPCYLADDDPALVRVTEPIPPLSTPIWLLVHPDMRRTARVRVLRQALIDAFEPPDLRARLSGA